jgi:hypothetical protein
MRSLALGGILGVVGPVNAAGWISTTPAHTFRMLLNDRPSGPAQNSIPVTVPVRSDFAYGLLRAIKSLHDQGCVLPLLSGPMTLPSSLIDSSQPIDPLPYLGRVLTLAAATALEHLSASDFASDYLLLPVGVREC